MLFEEICAMHDMVVSKLYRHMSVRALALYAQRIGRVYAHPTTWYRIILERWWIRPRERLYPDKPTLGLRAWAPNGAWHVDRSVIRLLDGTRAYLSAVIDNYSRRILAWHLADNALALPTAQVIAEAAKNVIAGVDEVAVIVDKGGENRSSEVNVLFEPPTALTRFVAQVDLDFSNRATRDRRGLVFQRTLR